MREILFRGKDVDDGRWYEGFYLKLSETTYVVGEDYERHPENTKHYIVFDRMTDWGLPNKHLRADVDPSTVGQYTGMKDKNGMRIFEGDLVKTKHGRICKVMWFDPQACWDLKPVSRTDCPPPDLLDLWHSENLEVIGNVWDNPGLLEATP